MERRENESIPQWEGRLREELIPHVEWDRETKQARRSRRRAWWRDVVKDATGNALGTFVGGVVLLAFASFVGILNDVPGVALAIMAGVALVLVTVALLLARRTPPSVEEEAEDKARRLARMEYMLDEYRAAEEVLLRRRDDPEP